MFGVGVANCVSCMVWGRFGESPKPPKYKADLFKPTLGLSDFIEHHGRVSEWQVQYDEGTIVV